MLRSRIKYNYVLLAALMLMLAMGLGYIYYAFNPDNVVWFPKCPIYALTGLKCPGCGSQRALHALLHWDIRAALHYNAMLIVSIPYILLSLVASIVNWQGIRTQFFGYRACWIVLVIVVLFTIIRNIIPQIL